MHIGWTTFTPKCVILFEEVITTLTNCSDSVMSTVMYAITVLKFPLVSNSIFIRKLSNSTVTIIYCVVIFKGMTKYKLDWSAGPH